MAGEELEKNTPVAEEAKEAVVDAGQNKSLADRYGQDYVDRVKGDGLQDATGGGGYSRKELASEFRYGRGDTSVDDTVAKYQGMVDSGEFKGNNQATDFLKMHGVNFDGGGDVESPVEDAPIIGTPPRSTPSPEIGRPMPEPDPFVPAPTNPSPFGSINQNQTVIQDNDINSSVDGDNNDVSINQDNSARQRMSANSATNLMDNYVAGLRQSRMTT